VKNAHFKQAKIVRNVKKTHFTSSDLKLTPLTQALQDAGTGEPKRAAPGID